MQSGNLSAFCVEPNRFDMRVFERKVYMYYAVQFSKTSFSVQVDVREKSVNISNLLSQGFITSKLES